MSDGSVHVRDRASAGGARTIAAAVIGNTLEFYDFTVYAAFATTIAKVFFPTTDGSLSLMLSIATFGVGFLARPLGAAMIGSFADRRGRKAAMMLTIWMMAAGSCLIGILPGYDSIGLLAPLLLIAARLMQGFSTGGEMGPATAFLIESAKTGHLGLAGSWQMASQHFASILAGAVGLLLASLLPPQSVGSWAWRIPFLLGVLIAPVGYWIRRSVDETLVESVALENMGAVIRKLGRDMPGRILRGILLIAGATVTQYFFLYGTTYAIHTLHFTPGFARAINIAVGAVGVAFSLLGGMLTDRYGAARIVIISRLATSIALYPAFLLILSDPTPAVFLGTLMVLMIGHAVGSAASTVILTDLFPMEVRTSGVGLSYALGVTLFGGTAQLIFTAMIDRTGNPVSWILYVAAIGLLSVVAVCWPSARRDRDTAALAGGDAGRVS